jgi:hypothetical protein
MSLTLNGSCSQMLLIIATSQAICSDGAKTMVWNEPGILRPSSVKTTPGMRTTQPLGRTGGSSSEPGFLASGFREVLKSNAKKLRVNSTFNVAHVGIQLQIPKF